MTFNTNMPPGSIIYLLAGIGLTLVVAVLLIVPTMRDTAGMSGQIAATRAQIEEKRLLDPLYAQMVALNRQQEELGVLPIPEPTALNDDLEVISGDMERITRLAGMDLVSVTPSPTSLEGDSQILLVTLVVEGDFSAFRDLLEGLLGIPYIQALSGLQIREIVRGREYTLQLMVLLRK